MKKWITVLGVISALVVGERVYHFATDGFYESRIVANLPNREEWESPITPPEGALLQPYYYLGCGGQSFVFTSEDGKFVLKFFKHHRWKKTLWNILHGRSEEERVYSRDHSLRSAIYALKYLPSESRVEYVHLNTGDHQLPTVTCIDRLTRVHHFDLNKYQFLLQRKGCTLKEQLLKRKKKGDLEGAKQDIKNTLNLYIACHQKGIENHDPKVLRNFGFFKDTPIVIDSGALWEYLGENPAPIPIEKMKKETQSLIKWAKIHYPPLTQTIEEWINDYSVN
ncbi:MAG: hypothetical protein KBC64_00075 [Simkaniaceae bacterium]|nr:hypothetical protein [Simkaniaceae bacterium]